jgi:Flp pilus assembly protein TadD
VTDEKRASSEEDFADLGDELTSWESPSTEPTGAATEPPADALEQSLDDALGTSSRPAPGRPLYRPPSTTDALPSRPPRRPEQVRAEYNVDFSDDFDDEGATRIAVIPAELIEALNLAVPKRTPRQTEPPPSTDDAEMSLDLEELEPAAPPKPPPPRPPPPPPPPVARVRADEPTALRPAKVKVPPPPAEAPPEETPPGERETLVGDPPEAYDPWSAERETMVGDDLDVDADAPEEGRPTMPPGDLEDDVPELVVYAESEPGAAEASPLSVPRMPADLWSEGAAEPTVEADAEVDALHDADTPPHGVAVPSIEPKARADRGAETAKRTVRRRKPRREVLPLVGTGASASRARVELLVALAEGASKPHRARLLASAAELCERTGNARSVELYDRAHREAERDLHLLRVLRKQALARGECAEAARLLALEAESASNEDERALALTLLAEIELHQLGRTEDAEAHARSAQALRPLALVPPLLVAEAAARREAWDAVAEALLGAADAVPTGPLRGSLLFEAGLLRERAGAAADALGAHQRAVEADASKLGAYLGVARGCLRAEDPAAAAAALERAAALVPNGREPIDRLRARILSDASGEHAAAATALGDARSALGVMARADAERKASRLDASRASYEEASKLAFERDRALALLDVAELAAGAGDLEGAAHALTAATHADPGFSLIEGVREMLARRTPGAEVLRGEASSEAATGERFGDLARALLDGRWDAERAGLVALGESDPRLSDVLTLDLAATIRDGAGLIAALERQADQRPPAARLHVLLALSSTLEAAGDAEGTIAALRKARDLSPGDPVILRPLAELTRTTSPLEAAALWLEESAGGMGEPSAFAATIAGRLLERTDGDAASAYRRALQAAPGYLPAGLALLPLLEARDASAEAREVHRAIARRLSDPSRRAMHLASALALAEGDPAAASDLLRELAPLAPSDGALLELVLDQDARVDPELRASILEGASSVGAGPAARVIRLGAATAWEQAGASDRAAALYRTILLEDETDLLAVRGLDRAELASGQLERLAERRIRDVRGASHPGEKLVALETLAELDLHERRDDMKAMLSLESILEIAPGHLPSLRALERLYMERDMPEELARIERALVAHLNDPSDASGPARLGATLLLPTEAGGETLDAMWLLAARRGVRDLGVLRRARGAALERGELDAGFDALAVLAEESTDELTRLWYALRAAAVAEDADEVPRAAALLASAADAAPGHPIANEELARLHLLEGRMREAAERLETAADAASGDVRRARLWYAASAVWLDHAGDPERGLLALEATTRADVTYLDAFERARDGLVERGDLGRALRLTEARIAAGADVAALATLHAERADLCERAGDAEGASEALRTALGLNPDDAHALRRLAELHLEAGRFEPAADALIRIARHQQDRDELRWVFLTLGEIYDQHLPDPKRADVAYRRVLKLVPGDEEALDRLAKLHLETGELEKVEDILDELAAAHPGAETTRDRFLDLAATLETKGEVRKAEETLERVRKAAPTDVLIIKALAELYRRQNAGPALSVHLGRATSELRREVDEHPEDSAAWTNLVDVLSFADQADAARCAAMAALALGIQDIDIARLLDASGKVPGAGNGASRPEVAELIAPRLLPSVVREALRLSSPVAHKVLPFDPKAFHAERVRGHSMQSAAERIGKELGVGDVQILVTDLAPRICVPVADDPAIIVVGRELSSITTDDERAFLFARAIQIARAGLSIAMRAQPAELALFFAAMIATFDPSHRPEGIDRAAQDELKKRIGKAMPRRLASELEPLFVEISGRPDVDPAKLGLAVADFGNRFGLVTTGDLGSALSSLVRLAGQELGEPHPEHRAEILRRMPETWALLHFAISDAHFEARRRAGADRRA